MKKLFLSLGLITSCVLAPALFAHDDDEVIQRPAFPATNQLPLVVEKKGPVKAPLALKEKVPVSGQGFWKFVAMTNDVPVPAAAVPFVKGAHGTLIVDVERDTVYWGLKKVGWVAFSNELTQSWIVQGDNAFTHNNLHGADILPRKNGLPLIVAADNEGYKVYVTDTTFLHPQMLGVPPNGPYTTNKTYRPTDVAIINTNDFFVTDGYARGYFMEASISPLEYHGHYFGGHSMSKTPHGITYNPEDNTLLISARPEGQLKRWSVDKHEMQATYGLPAGTYLCDVDLWGDYALAACLNGPFIPGTTNQSAGPLMVLNLKKKTIASIIKPKEDLGYDLADHMHDAVWYFHKNGKLTDVYIIFTNWQPGGVGALKLVNVAD